MANPAFKINQSIAPGKMDQLNYNENSKSKKTMEITPTPFMSFADGHTAAVFVGKGNLCRCFGATTEFVAFGPSDLALPDSSTQNAAKMSAAVQIFVATDEFIRTSGSVTRIEVIED